MQLTLSQTGDDAVRSASSLARHSTTLADIAREDKATRKR
jgi:hypothetical protein